MKAKPILRSIASPFVAIAFLVLAITGALLFFHVKSGPIVFLHEWFGWIFLGTGLLHLLLNARPLAVHLKQWRGITTLAIAVTLVAALTIIGLNHPNGDRHHRGAPWIEADDNAPQ